MRDSIHFIDLKRCKDKYDLYKGRGCASIIIENNKLYVVCKEIIKRGLPLSSLKDSIEMLNQFGYTVCKSKEVLKKYQQ